MPRGRILGRNPEKKEFSSLLFAQSPLQYTFALRFLFLQTHEASHSFFSLLLYTVKEKVGKPHRKPYPLSDGLRNPYRNLKSENSQDYAQKPQQNCTFINWLQEYLLRQEVGFPDGTTFFSQKTIGKTLTIVSLYVLVYVSCIS